MRYGPNVENLGLIAQKAKDKRDGIYSFRGLEYRVKAGRFTHYAHGGKAYECCGHFVVQVGQYDGYSDSARKLLKTL